MLLAGAYEVSNKQIVILPFTEHGIENGELDTSIAEQLARALGRINDVFSPEQQVRIARLMTNAPAFAPVVSIPELGTLDNLPSGISVQPLDIGPVRLSLTLLLVHLLPMWDPIIVTGTIERDRTNYRIWARLTGSAREIMVSNSLHTAGSRGGLEACVPTESEGKPLFQAVDELAYQLVVSAVSNERYLSWKSLYGFASGLRAFDRFLTHNRRADLRLAENCFRQSVTENPQFDQARFYLATVQMRLGTQLDIADEEFRYLMKAHQLFEQIFVSAPEDSLVFFVARLGYVNTSIFILDRFYDSCANTQQFILNVEYFRQWVIAGDAERLSTQLASSSAAQSQKIMAYNLLTTFGRANRLIGKYRLKEICAPELAHMLTDIDIDDTWRRAETAYRGALKVAPEWETAQRSLAHLLSSQARRLIGSGTNLNEARRRLEEAVRIRNKLKINLQYRFLRGALAEDYLRLAKLSGENKAAKDLYIAKARSEYGTMVLHQNGWSAVWGKLRFLELVFWLGNWRQGIGWLPDALREAVKHECANRASDFCDWFKQNKQGMGALDEMIREGLFLISASKDVTYVVIEAMKIATSNKYDYSSILIRALLSEALLHNGDKENALKEIKQAINIFNNSGFYYSNRLLAKILLVESKILVAFDQLTPARESIERALSVMGGDQALSGQAVDPMMHVDLAEIFAASGDMDTAKYHCNILKRNFRSSQRAYLGTELGAKVCSLSVH